MSDPPGTITTTLTTPHRGELMTSTTNNTRIKTFAYTLAGLVAFASFLALVIWIIIPTERDGDIAPQPPFDTAYWIIVAGAAALTFLVILPVSTVLVRKLIRR